MKIFKVIKNSSDRDELQNDIFKFEIWCCKNGLILNPSKCQTITFSRKRNPHRAIYNISNQPLQQVLNFKDLGVYFTFNLEFNEHISLIISKANSMLGFIKRWCKEFDDPYITMSLYNCHVRPHLEYASQVWSPFYEIHKSRIEAVQHRFIRFALKGLPWEDPYDLPPYHHRIMLLQMETLAQRRINNDLIFFYQLLTGSTDAPDLLAAVSFNFRGSYQLRNLNLIHCSYRRTNYGFNEPLARMSRLFNSNSLLIDFNLNKAKLKKLLKTSGPLLSV